MPAFPTVTDDDAAVTPYRHTEAFFNCAEPITNRHPWSVRRAGQEIARSGDHGSGVMLLPSGSWYARSLQSDQLFEYSDFFGACFLPVKGNLTVTQEIVTYPNVKSVLPLGITPAQAFTDEPGDYWLLRQVPAGAQWSVNLVGDAAAFPSPVPTNQLIPQLRLAVGRFNDKPNTAFCLRVQPSIRITDDADALGIFMFGGPAAVLPSTRAGGEFALLLLASGDALLYERVGVKATPAWKVIRRIQWARRGQVSGRAHSILIIPEGTNGINILAGGQGPVGSPGQESTAFVTGEVGTTGYAGKKTTTGAGVVRMDIRADLRMPFQISQLMFQGAQGLALGLPVQIGPTLRGDAFHIPFPLGANTEIRIDVDKELPEESVIDQTDIIVRLFALGIPGQTAPETECAKATNGSFLSIAGAQAYVPTFEFKFVPIATNPSTLVYTGVDSPFLHGYTASVDGVVVVNTNVAFTGGTVTHVDITSQDLELGTESLGMLVDDLTDTIRTGPSASGGLENRADTRLIIQTAYDPVQTGRRCRIFDGVMVRAAGSQRPGVAGGYPAAGWHSYNITGQGQWRRVAQPGQTNWRQKQVSVDNNAPVNPQTGIRPPLRVTEMIDLLLESAGYTSAYRNVMPAEWDFLRLFTNGKNEKDMFLQPGARLADTLDYLAKQYLGAVLHWDANYADGQWVLLFPPKFSAAGNYTFKWNFITTATGKGAGGLVHRPESYPANTTFIQRITKIPEPPEANYVRVVAGVTVADYPDKIQDQVGVSVSAHLYNSRALAMPGFPDLTDPTSLDYVNGQFKGMVWVEPGLWVPGDINQTFKAIRFMCRRIFDAVAYGRTRVTWHSPLFFITHERDATRVRPLRTYDLVSVDGDPVVLDSGPGISYKWDGNQGADYSGYIIPEPLPVVIGPGDNSGFE